MSRASSVFAVSRVYAWCGGGRVPVPRQGDEGVVVVEAQRRAGSAEAFAAACARLRAALGAAGGAAVAAPFPRLPTPPVLDAGVGEEPEMV